MRVRRISAVIAAFGLLVSACSGAATSPPTEAAATQGATGTEAPASQAAAASPVATVGPNLAAIMARGYITNCDSPDFPPYESVDSNGNFYGFDVDMFDEAAKRMGLTVKWIDMPFDVTLAQLEAGKCDVSVSTQQKTPDNQNAVNFTVEYEPATTAFLERNNESITLTKVQDIVGYTVGVQTGGTNEKWIQDNLVTPGLMPAANVKTYEREDACLLDLVNGRIQLMTTEGNTGAVYAKTKPVKIELVTTKMNASNYVIMVRKGWDDLTNAIDVQLQAMIADGTMKFLEQKWNLVEPPPGA